MLRVLYKGKIQRTMVQYEAIETLEENADYDIIDHPDTYITNAQMTYALSCIRLFPAGDTYICSDDGTFKVGHIYRIDLAQDGTKGWTDITAGATDDTSFAKTDEQNTFTAENTFKENTQFDKGISSDGDVTVTNSVVKVLDNTNSSDIVTQYGADEIVKESAGQTYNYKYPDKSGTIALESDIAFQEYESFIELTPSSAVNGTLTEEQFNNLTTHDDIGIKLNNEYYRLADGEHTPGLRSYTHTGWNGDSTQDKSINITTSTKAWTLVLGKNKYYRHYVQLTMDTDKTFYYDFSSTQEEPYTADTLPAMPDNTIALFSMLVNGHYSNVSGMIYRSAGVLKSIMHGMYTDNGSSFTYLNLSGAEVTFNQDTVVKV